jgi:hypothetical protein
VLGEDGLKMTKPYTKETHESIKKVLEYHIQHYPLSDGVIGINRSLIEAMLEEIERLQSIIDDYREGIAKTLEERCPSDEHHCGCVPILRQEIERLKSGKDNREWWES